MRGDRIAVAAAETNAAGTDIPAAGWNLRGFRREPANCGGRLRSGDLQVMSLASYWAAPPRDFAGSIYDAERVIKSTRPTRPAVFCRPAGKPVFDGTWRTGWPVDRCMHRRWPCGGGVPGRGSIVLRAGTHWVIPAKALYRHTRESATPSFPQERHTVIPAQGRIHCLSTITVCRRPSQSRASANPFLRSVVCAGTGRKYRTPPDRRRASTAPAAGARTVSAAPACPRTRAGSTGERGHPRPGFLLARE